MRRARAPTSVRARIETSICAFASDRASVRDAKARVAEHHHHGHARRRHTAYRVSIGMLARGTAGRGGIEARPKRRGPVSGASWGAISASDLANDVSERARKMKRRGHEKDDGHTDRRTHKLTRRRRFMALHSWHSLLKSGPPELTITVHQTVTCRATSVVLSVRPARR